MAAPSRSSLASFFAYPGEAVPESLVFLGELHEEDWSRLVAAAETRRFRRGEAIIGVGEIDRSLYVVVDGILELVFPDDETRQTVTVGPHSVVGEMAFLDGRPRSASVRARTDGELLRLSFESFEVLSARFPRLGRAILLDLGRILALRLERTSELLALERRRR